jgi:hypothetical protein
VQAIRADMASLGIERAEDLCPEYANLIKYLRESP